MEGGDERANNGNPGTTAGPGGAGEPAIQESGKGHGRGGMNDGRDG